MAIIDADAHVLETVHTWDYMGESDERYRPTRVVEDTPTVGRAFWIIDGKVHDRVEAEVTAHESSGALEEIDVAGLEKRAFADIGLRLDAALRDRCSALAQEAWWNGVRLYPDAIDALRALRGGGLRLGLCSNAAYRSASMHGQLHHTGLDTVIDSAVFSAEVGWRKPSPRLFAAALQALGARAEHTVFVGDRMREDIVGAASALGSELFDRITELPDDPGQLESHDRTAERHRLQHDQRKGVRT